MSKIISFPQGGTAYIQTTLEGLTLEEKRARGNVTALDCLTGPQLVDLHNLIAANIGQGRVKRFADAKTAVRRTWAMLEAYEAEVKAEASTLDEFHAKHQAMHAPKVTTSVSNPPNIPNTDRVKASISNPSNKPPRWARPKHEAAGRIAYRPKDGSIQYVMYMSLTRQGGTPMEEFCAIMRDSGTRDKTLYTPPMVWSALRYLFVDRRGYGLDFDGQRLSLLVPKDERDGAGK